ncbi:hypothetical protein FIC_02475 [Flavobacteriaceae bacterium 3519-10]|nr:hypothetical protein FIC_02475 [Flavobacteriaceae bacterium 3519-10]
MKEYSLNIKIFGGLSQGHRQIFDGRFRAGNWFDINILMHYSKLINNKSKSGKKWELLEIFL